MGGVAGFGAAILGVGVCVAKVHVLARRAVVSTGLVIGLLLGQRDVLKSERMHRAGHLVGAILRLLVIVHFADADDVVLVVAPTATDCSCYAGEDTGRAFMFRELCFRGEMGHAQRRMRSSRRGWRRGNRR